MYGCGLLWFSSGLDGLESAHIQFGAKKIVDATATAFTAKLLSHNIEPLLAVLTVPLAA